jgi:hypothetical protein
MKIKFATFNESVSNLSKIRKWKVYDEKRNPASDLYFIYDLSKKELGKYLNTWFTGIVAKSKDGDRIYRDEVITVKKVDNETKQHLCHKQYNPVTITIMCPTGARFKQDEAGNDLYEMKAQIHSIDDSSFGVWWSDYYGSGLPLDKLKKIRDRIMYWINLHTELNGEQFLDYCISLGASEESKDYN